MKEKYRATWYAMVLLCIARFASAGSDENKERLAILKEVDFNTANSASVVALAAPSEGHKATFHGCAVISEWKSLSPLARDKLAARLRQPIQEEITAFSKAGDDDLIVLQPMGVVYGNYGVRMDTDRGLREFAICLPKEWDGYIYIYSGRSRSMGLSPGKVLMSSLEEFNPIGHDAKP